MAFLHGKLWNWGVCLSYRGKVTGVKQTRCRLIEELATRKLPVDMCSTQGSEGLLGQRAEQCLTIPGAVMAHAVQEQPGRSVNPVLDAAAEIFAHSLSV